MNNRPNILLITADQWRGDCLGTVGHPVVKTPHLDTFARSATVFEQHYAATAPCSPARASLYTGLYQMNHRVVRNGAPLDHRFDNIARAARRAGYAPALFGYTDMSPDPRRHHPNDPLLQSYEGILPGFDLRQGLPENDKPWLSWLAGRGRDPRGFDQIHHAEPEDGQRISRKAPSYSRDETQTAFLTNAFLNWLEEQDGESRPWMAHVSFLRPHPPVIVPEPYNTMYDPEDGPEFAGAQSPEEAAALHPLVAALQQSQLLSSHIPGAKGHVREMSRSDLRRIRSLYYGMISEVDAQLGRIFRAIGEHDDTLIIFTSDHAEMMGDHWMLGKGGFYRQSYHIPLIIRMPGGSKANRVTAYTSSVDIFPTLLDLLDIEPGHAPDGDTLRPFLKGDLPHAWRDSALWEFDFRQLLNKWPHLFQSGTTRHAPALLSRYGADWQYVHIPGAESLLLPSGQPSGPPLNLAASHPQIVQENLAYLLSERMRHNDETLARKMVWDYYS